MRQVWRVLAAAILLTAAACGGSTDPGDRWAGSYSLATVGGNSVPHVVEEEEGPYGTDRRLLDSARIVIRVLPSGEVSLGMTDTVQSPPPTEPATASSFWLVQAEVRHAGGDVLHITYRPPGSIGNQWTDTVTWSPGELRAGSFARISGRGEFVFTRD